MRLNKWVLAACLVLSVAMAATGTLAYLTDYESDKNVLTLGDVNIELNEKFEQGITLLPGASAEKIAEVSNVGVTDAYVWATVAVPSVLDSVDEDGEPMLKVTKGSSENWDWETIGVQKGKMDGVEYNVYTALYKHVLAAKETVSEPVISAIALDSRVDIAPDGSICFVEGGKVIPAVKSEDDAWKVDDLSIVYVSAYAIQVKGFEKDGILGAYNAFNAQWSEEEGGMILEWADPIEVDSNTEDLTVDPSEISDVD